MTVQKLIDLLKKEDPLATVYIETYRHNLEADIHEACEAAVSGIDDVLTYPDNEDVYLLESYRRSYL